MKRILFLIALAGVVSLPFWIRPTRPEVTQAQDTLVIVTPHNEAIRHEYALGFQTWYKNKTGRSVFVDWRVLGGTSEITRYLKGQYIESFKDIWQHQGHTWSHSIEATLLSGRVISESDKDLNQAHSGFLNSKATAGVDLYFGGDAYDYDEMATAGMLVQSSIMKTHSEWFSDAIIPQQYSGEKYYDPKARWFGSVISCYGIIYNRDCLKRLGIAEAPKAWVDLADPRYKGQIALCDPTRSGSMTTAFENIIQQQMQLKVSTRAVNQSEAEAIAEGWVAGLRLIQSIGSNARYFTGSSQKVPIDVAAGDCAAGLVIDFYGNQQAEAVQRRAKSDRIGLSIPNGGTAYSVDPIGLLRGAPHQSLAELFLEYSLSKEGQALWGLKTGAVNGPSDYALRRMPIRKDFYSDQSLMSVRSDPFINPFSDASVLIYHPERTSELFKEIAFVVRVMCEDTHDQLVQAVEAALKAPEPARSRALHEIRNLDAVSYLQVKNAISKRLESKNKTEELRLASELGAYFRAHYAKALEISSADK